MHTHFFYFNKIYMNEKNEKNNTIKLLIIAYVPEIAQTNNNAMKNISNNVEDAFREASRKHNCHIDVTKIIQVNKSLVISKLKKIAKYLEDLNKKAIIYYYGHGDQIKDLSGDESDEQDEIWRSKAFSYLSRWFTFV